MCPLWPVHQIFLYLLILGPIWLLSFGIIGTVAQAASKQMTFQQQEPIWGITYDPADPEPVEIDATETIEVKFGDLNLTSGDRVWVDFHSDDDHIAEVTSSAVELELGQNVSTSFDVTGKFLGYATVCPEIVYYSAAENQNFTSNAESCLRLTVVRKQRAIDKAFTGSVIVLVCIMYINMAAALDLNVVKQTIRRPVGPVIGFFSQFVFMPLLGYGIAKLLIPSPSLQLGLFITGCSPGGGASNIWTLILGGNLDLSITMTAISTFAAFAMMPLWIFTLGATIFRDADLAVPYQGLGEYVFALVVPLAIGMLIRRYSVKTATFLVRILKPFAIFLIVFIVVFAIYTNLYLFELLTWEILTAGFLLPTLGYLLGGGTAALLRQDWKDVIAIAVETGVQNTGLSIFALRVSLQQPEADLTTALPVAVAIMTPIIPTVLFIILKIVEIKKRRGYVCMK